MKRALICGISGQDGAYLAKFLLDKGYEVHGTSRDASVSSFNNLVRPGIRDQIRLESMALTDKFARHWAFARGLRGGRHEWYIRRIRRVDMFSSDLLGARHAVSVACRNLDCVTDSAG